MRSKTALASPHKAGDICQWHDEGWRTGIFMGYEGPTGYEGAMAIVKPIGAYGTHPRNIRMPMEELIWPNITRHATRDEGPSSA